MEIHMDHLHDTNLLVLTEAIIPGFIKIGHDSPMFYAYSNGIDSYFPIDTPSNAWLSAAYFEKNAANHLDKDDYINTHDKILEALNLHGITYESPFTVEKVANDDEYSFIKLASDLRVFEQNYKHINPEERHEKAKELMNRYQALKDSGAKEDGPIPKIVEEYAGEHLKRDWPDIVRHRASRVEDGEGKEAYRDLAESKESKEIILRLLGMLDRRFGLDHHYDRGILDPYRSLLTTEEPKKEKIIIMVVNGKQYDHEKVASLNPLDLADQFGGEVLSSLMHNPSVYLKSAPEFVKVAVAQAIDARE
jgi:hypothetical protein